MASLEKLDPGKPSRERLSRGIDQVRVEQVCVDQAREDQVISIPSYADIVKQNKVRGNHVRVDKSG
jgi:hypothetical protein